MVFVKPVKLNKIVANITGDKGTYRMGVSGSYLLVINVIVVVAFVFAFMISENKGKLILAII